MGYRFNPVTGALDYFETGGGGGPTTEAEQAKRLIVTRKAAVSLSAMKLVKSDSATHVSVATNDDTFESAQVLGVALNAAINPDDDIEILLFGALQDASLSGFALNDLIYLGSNGAITNVAPVNGFYKEVGYSIGVDEVFINLKQTIIL